MQWSSFESLEPNNLCVWTNKKGTTGKSTLTLQLTNTHIER